MSEADKPKVPEIIVRGGTGTSKSEELFERRYREAEERRDIAAAEKELSRGQQQVDKPDGDGQVLMPGRMNDAVLATNQFTEHPEIPQGYVCLTIANRYGADTGERCLADVLQGINPDNPHDLALVIVCPVCEERSHKHQQDNQLRILQSNKRWELIQAGDPIIVWEEKTDSGLTTVEHYRSAGVVTESEPFVCDDCGTRYRIANNVLRPD